MGLSDIQEIFELLAYNFSFKIHSADDLEIFEEKLDKNFAKPSFLFDENDYLEEAILNEIVENGICDTWDTEIIERALRYGYYPMSLRKRITGFDEFRFVIPEEKILKGEVESIPKYRNVLSVRHHFEKLIITPETMHITKKLNGWINSKFKDYTLTFNRDFDQVIAKLLEAYPETWICPELVEHFKIIHQNPRNGVSVDTVEIWHNGTLVAGELGFITKNAYASLSGFHCEDDIGTVQMCVLGKYLFDNGFAYWDLGMSLPYKYRFGAKAFDREGQARFYKSLSEIKKDFPDREIPLTEFLTQK